MLWEYAGDKNTRRQGENPGSVVEGEVRFWTLMLFPLDSARVGAVPHRV